MYIESTYICYVLFGILYLSITHFFLNLYTLNRSWNFAVKDNGEEARLIIHMWIGLFYSCSTPRFIHSIPFDLEDSLEMSDGMVLPSVHKTATVSIGDSEAQDLEPIQEDGLVLNQVLDVLDLSIKKQDANDSSDISVSCHETKDKDASEAFIREAEIQDEGPAQCQAKDQALQVRPFICYSNCLNCNLNA